MYAIELYVPKFDNQGGNIDPLNWLSLEKQITEAFQGFTRYAGIGSWKGQEETVTVYHIITHEIPAEIYSIAEYVKRTWEQESVLYTVQPLEAVEYV